MKLPFINDAFRFVLLAICIALLVADLCITRIIPIGINIGLIIVGLYVPIKYIKEL